MDANALFDVPDALALEDAVALLADGRTATMLVEAAAVRHGERVLVEAAAGGVGTLLVQLARAAGATVVAAAGGARKLELARSLGADVAVDYTEAGWAQRAGDLDVVFDGVGGEIARAAFEQLAPGGRMLSFGLASGSWAAIDPEEAARRGVTLVRARPTREHTERALAGGPAAGHRPALPTRARRGRARSDRGALDGGQDPARRRVVERQRASSDLSAQPR